METVLPVFGKREKKMALRIQKLSDYGTENPIVARLSVQTKELLQFYNLDDGQRSAIFDLMFSKIQPKVMACFRIKEQLTKEIRGHQRVIDERGLKYQAQGRVYELPAIMDLNLHAETFLYNGKSALRDLTNLFLILFSKDFRNEARYDKVLIWAKSTFGESDELIRMLTEDEGSWIQKIVRMRNAVEHPGGHSGNLHVANFRSEEDGQRVLVIEPLWHLNGDPGIPIAREMDVMVSNLLSFCEDVLILCLEKFKTGPIVIVEIPEQDRDPKCPVRFKASLDISKIKLQQTGRENVEPLGDERLP